MYQQFQIALTLEMNTIKIYFYCDFSFTERNCILSEQEHSGRRKRKHNSYLTNRGFSTTSAENDECKDSWAVKKWNSDINYYRNTGKASKINQSYECNIDKPSLATKEIKTLVREEP